MFQIHQKGLSLIALIVLLAIVGLTMFFAVQFIPQFMEAGRVDSVLSSIEAKHEETPYANVDAIRSAIKRYLNINQMEELEEAFKVTAENGYFVIKVAYQRELNLIYEKQQKAYEKIAKLKRQ